MRRTLLYHGLSGAFDAALLTPGSYDTLLIDGGAPAATVQVNASGGSISVAGASGPPVPIVAPNDLPATNGFVHALGGVLAPPPAP